ncbi:MAG: hypothetical protein K6E40_03540 [Desulfovibrio sp.]|nr:hypothetical protein [Desulfovibrio sp.]
MTLLEMCMGESQEQNRTEVQKMMQEEMQGTAQNPMQEEMQTEMQAEAQNLERPAVQANAQETMQTDAPEVQQGVVQDGEQAETQAVKQSLKQDTEKDGASTSVKAGGIVVNLPGTKEKPILTTVSMRLNPEVKSQLQAMARRRHMSLGEFCAVVMAGVAQAGEAEETEAA